MPKISEQTLVIASQAVAWEVRSLRETVAGGAAREDDDRLLEDWLDAAEALERTYEVGARTVVNLPPCRERVGG